MLMNDILSICINNVKYSRTNDVYVILKNETSQLFGFEYRYNPTDGGGTPASVYNTTKFELYSFHYMKGIDGYNYYPVLVNSTDGKRLFIRWVNEEEIERFEVIGGVASHLYINAFNNLSYFPEMEVA